MTLRYYDGTQWLDAWDSAANNNALPVAVEVTLQVASPSASASAPPTKIVRVYSIPCVDINAISGTSGSGSSSTP